MNDKVKGDKFTPKKNAVNLNPKFTVLVKASGQRVEGLTIEHVHEPEQGDASIVFITKAGKKWKCEFHEFSFVFPATQPAAA